MIFVQRRVTGEVDIERKVLVGIIWPEKHDITQSLSFPERISAIIQAGPGAYHHWMRFFCHFIRLFPENGFTERPVRPYSRLTLALVLIRSYVALEGLSGAYLPITVQFVPLYQTK